MISVLEKEEYSKLSELAESVSLDEKIDFKCTFLAGRNGSTKLLGVAGINFKKNIPRFEHIIVREEYQKTSLAFRLMKAAEKLIKENNYDVYVALIPQANKMMMEYATKFGFEEYGKHKDSLWFYKRL